MRIVKPQKTKEFLKYTFTEIEIHACGLELARLNSRVSSLNQEKKAVVAQFKAKIEQATAEMDELTDSINNGYEHRYIECEVRFNDPNTGIKSTFRMDTGEFVKKESMTADEMQYELDFEVNVEPSQSDFDADKAIEELAQHDPKETDKGYDTIQIKVGEEEVKTMTAEQFDNLTKKRGRPRKDGNQG